MFTGAGLGRGLFQKIPSRRAGSLSTPSGGLGTVDQTRRGLGDQGVGYGLRAAW